MLAITLNQHLIIKKEEAGGNEDRAFLPARLQYKVKNIFPSENGVSCAKMMKSEEKNIRKKIYVKTLSMIKEINKTEQLLHNIGINLEFDDTSKPIAKTVETLTNNPREIICEALGLTLKAETANFSNSNISFDIDIYYPQDNTAENDFSITFEAMWDLIDKAADNVQCAIKVWDCFVEKKESAKERLIKDMGVIGFSEKE